MLHSDFLPTSYSANLRNTYWDLFQYACNRVEAFCPCNKLRVEIRHVLDGGPNWSLKQNPEGSSFATIKVPVTHDDHGVIFHEVFHSAFHFSPLWRDHKNIKWGDAFCDAFRYILEKEKSLNSVFVGDMEAWMHKPDTEVADESIQNTNQGNELFTYKPYGSRILNACDPSAYYASFLSIWDERNANPSHSLETYFNL